MEAFTMSKNQYLKGAQVLIVEDDTLWQGKLLALVQENGGQVVDILEDGERFAEFLDTDIRNGGTLDTMILDIGLKGTDGITLGKQALALYSIAKANRIIHQYPGICLITAKDETDYRSELDEKLKKHCIRVPKFRYDDQEAQKAILDYILRHKKSTEYGLRGVI